MIILHKRTVIVLISLLSYITGFIIYNLSLMTLWNETLGSETFSVLFWGGIAFSALAVPIYLSIINFINKRFNKKMVGFIQSDVC